MLAKRIIPVILHKRGQMVKGRRYVADRVVGRALQAALIHARRSVDELIIVDIQATTEQRGPDCALVSTLAGSCFSPLTVGGGVSTLDHIRDLLSAGADKVLIGSAATNIDFLETASAKYGAQCIVVSIDVLGDRVYTHNATRATEFDPVEYASLMSQVGAGELIVNDIARDGMMSGYNLNLIRDLSESVSVPVIACGGCGTYPHMHEAINAGASAVAAGSAWLFTDATPLAAARYLYAQGIEVRV